MSFPLQNNNYDRAAGFYDRLAGLIFGGAINKSQFILLQHHFPGTRIIIAGGGTGGILEELARIITVPLMITFVELSEKMLSKARARNTGHHEVEFICDDAGYFNAGAFDVVITPFLFDNFTGDMAVEVFDNLGRMLRPGGMWLFTDFTIYRESPWYQKLFLKLMYTFFNVFAQVQARWLPDTDSLFQAGGYTCVNEHFFYGNFIRAAVYLKA